MRWSELKLQIGKPGNRILIVGLFLLSVVATVHARSKTADESVRAQIVGTWSLVSRETHLANGQLVADPNLAASPMGRLIYDASGNVAAQLSKRGRTVEMLGEECGKAAATKHRPGTAQTILGYDAYFGTYTLHEKEGYVTHHLESAIFPGDIGADITRRIKVSGDMLTISFDTTEQDGTPVTRTLVWTRMK